MNINKCIIAGNVTRDPELNHTTAGKSVVNFTVASTERWKSETGEQKEHTEFIECRSWSKQAEVIAKYFRKGSRIYIEGKLRTEKWEKDGQKRQKIIVEVAAFEFIDRKDDHAPRTSAPAQQAAAKPARQAPDTSDDVPF